LAFIGRSPIQSIIVDYAGLENFAMHLADFEDEVMVLYAALHRQCRKTFELAASGPGRYMCLLENFTAETLGPARYAQWISPIYDEFFPMLHQAGKVIGLHYDGQLRSCRNEIRRAPFDVIESLTPPPDGDMTLTEARAAWPAKRFWSNLNVSLYQLPPAELRKVVAERVADGSVNGRGFALEVSEDRPANWRESIPVVLEALRDLRG
jgi:hypothetical protein